MFPLRRVALAATLAACLGCEITPLTRERLFGPERDAAAEPPPGPADAGQETPPPDGPPPDAPAPDGAPPDGPPVSCNSGDRRGIVSGTVVDGCTGRQVIASVGIDGLHTCSFAEKGSFTLRGVTVGCELTLTAGQQGFWPFSLPVVVPPGGLAAVEIRLERMGPCATPLPALSCSCTQPGCQ